MTEKTSTWQEKFDKSDEILREAWQQRIDQVGTLVKEELAFEEAIDSPQARVEKVLELMQHEIVEITSGIPYALEELATNEANLSKEAKSNLYDKMARMLIEECLHNKEGSLVAKAHAASWLKHLVDNNILSWKQLVADDGTDLETEILQHFRNVSKLANPLSPMERAELWQQIENLSLEAQGIKNIR